MKDIIKEEINNYIKSQNLTDEETRVMDTYVKELIEYIDPLLKVSDILKDKSQARKIVNMILEDLGDRIG
jgi:hypothetical protein|tara:strand:+ start:1931 stop:2140 length:210 start_codon:yes stop_codon:yes gene_type:complete